MTAKTDKTLLVSMEERWKNYRVQLKTCRREFSEEAVHDLRIAARRLLAVLDVVRALDPHPRVQKARKALKNQLDSLDDLRDFQVMLVDVVENLEALPQLQPFVELLHKREKVFLRSARKQTKTSHPSELSRRIEKIHGMLEKYSYDEEFNARLLGVVDQAFLSAEQAYGQIDASQPATIHTLRIAFKKFRYMVEIAHPILPEYPGVYLKRMHDYQSRMGVIQDVDVLLNTLADYTESNASSLDLEPARRYYEEHRAKLIAAYLDNKGELNIFWRNAPEQSFPWEKSHDPVHRPSRHRRASGDARLRRRQPAPADSKGTQEDAQDSQGPEGIGEAIRPDPDQPLSQGSADSGNPGGSS
jgi:CHAD domain-containing protein